MTPLHYRLSLCLYTFPSNQLSHTSKFCRILITSKWPPPNSIWSSIYGARLLRITNKASLCDFWLHQDFFNLSFFFWRSEIYFCFFLTCFQSSIIIIVWALPQLLHGIFAIPLMVIMQKGFLLMPSNMASAKIVVRCACYFNVLPVIFGQTNPPNNPRELLENFNSFILTAFLSIYFFSHAILSQGKTSISSIVVCSSLFLLPKMSVIALLFEVQRFVFTAAENCTSL